MNVTDCMDERDMVRRRRVARSNLARFGKHQLDEGWNICIFPYWETPSGHQNNTGRLLWRIRDDSIQHSLHRSGNGFEFSLGVGLLGNCFINKWVVLIHGSEVRLCECNVSDQRNQPVCAFHRKSWFVIGNSLAVERSVASCSTQILWIVGQFRELPMESMVRSEKVI